ncbi:hypothetical protein 2003DhaA_0090 [Vibrio phage ICP1]|uniref:Uncharacterized protein ORF17 n=1 Tax=Vibrio phage ICP1 TaxID=979525 RepID=F1D139_9CAUD|nr:hypothetical protein ViPhICP1_gp017 [Vibrio phage ICP1]ADX89198.1 hypothetical protein TUST1-2_00080 [Vibrio phage ICP1_2001_A]ADX89428.1 hypothetical protein TUST1-10_00080 [Vibrio phage ICP1_2004_A]APD17892.1 hypothetical protein [Vibrio phage JSF4]ASV41329.1 hypothetical protein [Vibrio phage JSF5]ASV41565.1 hypothetical protein [Vibrio phage JSF6]ASV41703.1 hypothetical protein [Vibrio phage JSF1]ASV42072.1 hypothetical protein [Vibrio phage JSF2]AXQ70642.1 hypothetical protein ICP12
MNTQDNAKYFPLTFSQVKALINTLGRDETETFINDINDQPEFMENLGVVDSVGELINLYESGCASNAHASVYYHQAQQCMIECSDSIEGQLECEEMPIEWNPSDESFAQFCSKCCVMAVESYIRQFEEVIEVLQQTDY